MLLFFILGLCVGSFALAMTMRMFDGRDWVNGRSECEECHTVLKWYDLVPLISWLSTGGKCRYCRKKLSWQYPAVELLSAMLYVISYKFWPYGFTKVGLGLFGLWLVMLAILTSLVVFDLKWYILPDKLVYVLIGLAGASKLTQILYFQAWNRIPGLVLGVAVGSGIFYVIHMLSKGKYIGGGDVTYGIFSGLLLGSGFKSMLVISLASIIGTLAVLPSMLSKKTKLTSAIPFGPCLILATFVLYIFGDRIVSLLTTTYLFP